MQSDYDFKTGDVLINNHKCFDDKKIAVLMVENDLTTICFLGNTSNLEVITKQRLKENGWYKSGSEVNVYGLPEGKSNIIGSFVFCHGVSKFFERTTSE